MHRIFSALAAVCFFAISASAQDVPKFEVFGGYSYGNTEIGQHTRANLNGWNASATWNATHHYGFELDMSGLYDSRDAPGDLAHSFDSLGQTAKSRTRMHTVMAGPKFSFRPGPFTFYGHALFGGANRQVVTESEPPTGNRSNNSNFTFGLALGGGVDVKINDRVSVRALQLDYIRAEFEPSWFQSPNHARASFGLVFNFGKH